MAILERIRATGDDQAREIEVMAQQESAAILAEAQAATRQLYQAAYQEALLPVEGECARIHNQAAFTAACLVSAGREKFAAMAIETSRAQLADIRHSPNYPAILERLLFEMLPDSQADGEPLGVNNLHSPEVRLVIEADPRDQPILERILAGHGLKARVEYNLECWGGLNAHLPGGTLQMVNTVESRLERAIPYLKPRLMAWGEPNEAGISTGSTPGPILPG